MGKGRDGVKRKMENDSGNRSPIDINIDTSRPPECRMLVPIIWPNQLDVLISVISRRST